MNKEHYLKITHMKDNIRRSKQISLLTNTREYCIESLLLEYDKWVNDGFVPCRDTLE